MCDVFEDALRSLLSNKVSSELKKKERKYGRCQWPCLSGNMKQCAMSGGPAEKPKKK